ncbi:Crp/Fnr family transcriptional regulator [Pelagibacterium lacus]|nr:Crp/Fnr family transcriptional regulator [Pelagibacterium lacus]
MANELLIARLHSHVSLNSAERAALANLVSQSRSFSGRNTMLAGKLLDHHVHVIADGFACRYRDLPDGRRQILSLLLPGDLVDLRQFVLGGLQPPVAALSPIGLNAIPNDSLFALLEHYPRVTTALWSTTLVEESISREWLVSVGKRSAMERTAHLLCEIYLRLNAVERCEGARFALPLTQSELADVLGLSTVHVNRTLQELRRSGRIVFQGGMVEILDFPGLAEQGVFSPAYLHLRETPSLTAIPA